MLSVVVPSIRKDNLRKLYDSVVAAYSGEFEFIVISPYDLPENIKELKNIVYINDFGSPTRAMQRGIVDAKGDLILWGAADDGFYYPGTIDIAVKSLVGQDKSYVVGKYYEGSENPFMNTIKYYKINTHNGSRSRYIDDECLMLMVGVIPRNIVIELGGLDTIFEALPMAFNDFSVRLFNYGATAIFQDTVMFRCSHMPGHEGDHGPIHDGQIDHDEPLFRQMYGWETALERIKIDVSNWQSAPTKWVRRFGS